MRITRARRMAGGEQILGDAALRAAAERYLNFAVPALGHGTVRDYCDSADHLAALATRNGDLKDLQRPWMVKAVLGVARGRRGRLLEIGAGEPLVADLLRRLGHEVWVVDPYDGSGNGPTEYQQFRARYPQLRFVREQFGETSSHLKPASFDCIYSISVLEHIPEPGVRDVMAGMKRFLQPEGTSLHAVDHVLRGRGDGEHLARLRLMVRGWGLGDEELDRALAETSADIDTYYLSAESHNRWRNGVPYDDFPMRVCVSVQACTPARSLRVS